MKGEDMQAGLGAVLQALMDLEEIWDNDYVRVYPEDAVELNELGAMLRQYVFRTDEQALAGLLHLAGIESWEEGGSGAIFIPLPNRQQLGVDYNLGGSWNVQFYPNVEDSESFPLAILGEQWDVEAVAKAVAEAVRQFGAGRSDVALDDSDALDRIADTLDAKMRTEEQLSAIAIFTRQTGRKVDMT